MFYTNIPQLSYFLAKSVSLPLASHPIAFSSMGNCYLFLLPGLSLPLPPPWPLVLLFLVFFKPLSASFHTAVSTSLKYNFCDHCLHQCNQHSLPFHPKKYLSTAGILNDQLPMLPGNSRPSPLPHLSLKLCKSPLELLDVARLDLKWFERKLFHEIIHLDVRDNADWS